MIGCSQRVCTKEGQTTSWKSCPLPASKTDVDNVKEYVDNVQEEIESAKVTIQDNIKDARTEMMDLLSQLQILKHSCNNNPGKRGFLYN